MATVTHYIYSHYDPAQRKALEKATGQEPVSSPEPEADPWQTESSFGAQRRLAAAPKFVPAIVSYDEINDMMTVPEALPEPTVEEANPLDVSGWYRSLTSHARSTSTPPVLARQSSIRHASTSISGTSASAHLLDPASPVTIASASPASGLRGRRGKEVNRRANDDWFISRALRSAPTTVPATPPSTLADILAREPPPLPSERRFAPPVFLTLGPTNKGFSMLRQSGWSEGEPLGPGFARRAKGKEECPLSPKVIPKTVQRKERSLVKGGKHEVQLDDDGEISEVRDVIDLTLSDSDEDDAEDVIEVKEEDSMEDLPAQTPAVPSTFSSHNPRALITPLPTVLKSDRLGIGLKAKTVGPYKESKKRVTHSVAAIAAHMRAAEDMRLMKKRWGRGARGFARMAKAESEHRRSVLASLKD